MEKQKFSDYLKATMIDCTNKQRMELEGVEDPAATALKSYFSKGELKMSEIRLSALKELFNDLGQRDKIDHISLADIAPSKVEAIRFAVMRMTSNPNGHDYGTTYFLVGRPAMGFKQDGNLGKGFPSSDSCKWEIAPESKVEELAQKYVELAKTECDFREFVKASSAFLSAFVDFSEINI